MSRRKRNLVPFPYYQTMNVNGLEKHYTRLPYSLMKSNAVQELSHTAYRIFIEMMLCASWKEEFTFPRGCYKGTVSNSTFSKAIKELEEAGIIDIKEHNKNLRKSNVYAWSSRWKEKEHSHSK